MHPFMQFRQHLQNLIRWKQTRKARESIPYYSTSKPTTRTRLPNELLIEIIDYLHEDRSTLYQLSLVSRDTRSIAQPLLFCNMNNIGTMSSRAYIRFLRCRRKAYRHVLLYVQSLTIDFPLRSRPSLNNRVLLFSMSQVTHLTINLHHKNQKMRSILKHCSDTFRLEELTVISKMIMDPVDIPIITDFISEQKCLKRLTIAIHPYTRLFFKPEALTHLETLRAGWMQLCNILPDRPLIRTVAINEDEWIPYVHIEPAMERELGHLLSLSVDVKTMMRLVLGDFLEDLEFLEITNTYGLFQGCQIDGLCQRVLPLKKLRIFILNYVQIGWNWDSKQLVDDLFLKYPSLEKVVLREVGSEECFLR